MSEARTVVLLHGLMRTSLSMRALQSVLENDGYKVLNLSYPSTRRPLAELGVWLHDRLMAENPEGPLSFVTHSMGGLVMRSYMQRPDARASSRAVMIAPPNMGASAADRASLIWLHRLVAGPAILDMRTSVIRIGPPTCAFGVIAGGTGTDVGYAPGMPGDNDGRVRVEETKLDGMADFLLVPRRHTFIMRAPEVIAAVRRFLVSGSFSENAATLHAPARP